MDIYFTLYSTSDGEPLASQSAITVYISKDGGTFAATTNSVSEIGRGLYKVTLTSTEASFTNKLFYQPVCTGAKTVTGEVSKDIENIKAGILNWAVAGNTLTLYNDSGTAMGTYDITTDTDGNIVKVEPHSGS